MIYNGIFYDGTENNMKLIMDNEFEDGPILFYINNNKNVASINTNTIIMEDTEFNYQIEEIENEKIIIGTEIPSILDWLFSCFFHQKFFVLTNHQSV